MSMNPLRATVLQAGMVGMVCVVSMMSFSIVLDLARGESTTAAKSRPETRVPFDLFKTWNFDNDTAEQAPAGFSPSIAGGAGAPTWVVKHDPSAQSPPHLLTPSAPCETAGCFQVLLVESLQYEYLDLIVRLRMADSSGGSNGAAGVVLAARDSQNYYAVTANLAGTDIEVTRVQDGKATTLAHAELAPKKVAWHLLRVRRNTIISKEYIEVFLDGLQVFSVEDKTFGTGQIGLVTRGSAMAEFDNFTAAPLYSQKPLSGPAAY
jgi:hypothetical protein